MDYFVSNLTELAEAVDAGANFADYIYLQDGTDLTGANVTRELDYRIADGGHVTVGSSIPAWFVFEYDCSLTVRWEGECVLSFAPPYDGVDAVVRLVGWPEDGPEVRAVQDLLGLKGIKVLVGEVAPCSNARSPHAHGVHGSARRNSGRANPGLVDCPHA